MRGLRSIRSGQRVLEGIEAVQTIRRGDPDTNEAQPAAGARGAARARAELMALHRVAGALRRAA